MRLCKHRGKWAVRTSDGRRFSTGHPATAENREAAERAARQILSALVEEPETIAEIWATYMREHGERTIAAERLGYAWKALQPVFGHLRPEQVTRSLCREYAASRNVSPGTTLKELSTLRTALRWNDKNTPAVFELPPSPQPKERHLTRDEARALIDAAVHPHIKLFIRLAIATAARKSALLSLQWPAVDFDKGIIRLGHIQGGKGRAQVPINESLEAALRESHRASQSQWVIEYAGDRVKSIKRGFASACERAGLEDVTPHTLRHTSAVWMAEGGRRMEEIAQYLGHTDARTTYRVYARYSPDYLRHASSLLDV